MMKFKFRRAVFILTVLVVLAGAHLYIRTQNTDIKYRVTGLKTELNKILARNRTLGIRAAKKENLRYIEETARKKLGMVYPEEVTYIVRGSAASSAEAKP